MRDRANLSVWRGCLAYYELDATTGNETDATGNGHTLTQNNTVTSGAGVIGSARVFNGTTQFFSIASGSATDFNFTSSFSLRARVNASALTTERDILSKYLTTGNQRAFVISLSSSQTFRCTVSANGTATTAVDVPGVTVATGTWYDYFGGYDAARGVIWVSLDGGPITTAAFTGPVFVSTADLNIGSVNNGTFGRFAGSIDTVGIWSRKLHWDEIRFLHKLKTYGGR